MSKIKKLSPENLDEILEISKASFSQVWPRSAFEKYRDSLFVAEDNGEIAGFIVIKIVSNQGKIKLIAVNPNFRGKGIGKSLMEYAFKYFAENRVKEIMARSRLHNEAGCAFLKSFGFKIKKTIENYYLDGEDAFLMIKKKDG